MVRRALGARHGSGEQRLERMGELVKTFQSNGARTDLQPRAGGGPRSQRQAAEEAGISKRQEKTAVRIANVPEADFEAAVESDDPPTVTKLAHMARDGIELRDALAEGSVP